jgi:hypothetical protein
MKYFTVTYISQKTLHPEGYKTFTEFVAADTNTLPNLRPLTCCLRKTRTAA